MTFRDLGAPITTLWRKGLGLWRTLWVRVVLLGASALIALLITRLLGYRVPEELATRVPGTAADRLLDIIAGAMLAVVIFSLTVMVSLYHFTAQQWTPRVHRLITSDPTTQNTLATFIGAYVYALTAIILREMGIFAEDQGLVLFWMTVLVLVLVVFTIIRWTIHLQSFGSLGTTTSKVESVTRRQFQSRLRRPCLGARPLLGQVPQDAEPVAARRSGYVTHIYQESLQAAAEKADIEVYLIRTPGAFVHLGAPAAWIVGTCDDAEALIHDHVIIEDERSYEQDPRFGLIVMSEIGTKALSPGINDPGTAIDVITRLARILSDYETERNDTEAVHDRLHVPPLDPSDLLDDAFDAIARDGAGLIEVQIRLQRVLDGLMLHPDEGLAEAARDAALRQARRAMAGLSFAPDRERLRAALNKDVREALEEAKDQDVRS